MVAIHLHTSVVGGRTIGAGNWQEIHGDTSSPIVNKCNRPTCQTQIPQKNKGGISKDEKKAKKHEKYINFMLVVLVVFS